MFKFLSKFVIHNLKIFNLLTGEKNTIFRNFKTKFKIKRNISMSCSANEPITTFVFFDLETSDLIRGNKFPKIIELSMVAVSRNFIKLNEKNKFALPRILHKLTLAICPNQAINVEASIISDLWNHTLEDVKPFDENTYTLIMQFINRLPGTICFVAHNGNRFDYPIFLHEIDLLKKIFPDNILCVDTLLAFREILVKGKPQVKQQTQIIPDDYDEVDKKSYNDFEQKKVKLSLDDRWNTALSSVLDNYNRDDVGKDECVKQTHSAGNYVLDTELKNNCSRPITPENDFHSMQMINEKTPEDRIIRSQSKKIGNTSQYFNDAKRDLFNVSNRPKNFKLSTIYEYLLGSEAENLHCAEADCISMLRCVCQVSPLFLEWADYHAKPLNSFKQIS